MQKQKQRSFSLIQLKLCPLHYYMLVTILFDDWSCLIFSDALQGSEQVLLTTAALAQSATL